MSLVHPAVAELTKGVADRVAVEPDLDDFLAWTAGTLEYWVHIIASSVGRRMGWASSTEVPYITGCPSPRSKSDEKWADGAFLFDDIGVLLEVKTIPMRAAIGATITKVPPDFAALLSLDWKRTLDRKADKYAGNIWIERRQAMRRLFGLQLTLVHGESELGDVDESVRRGIAKGVAAVEKRFETSEPPWLSELRTAFASPPERLPISADRMSAVLFAWDAEVPLG